MEFFAFARIVADNTQLQEVLTVSNLPVFCASVDEVFTDQGHHGEIYCLWGQFIVNREAIRDGVRFSLPGCPNALAWTVAANLETPGEVVVHCTINRRQPDPDFAESIRQFVDDWAHGLEQNVSLLPGASSVHPASEKPAG